MPSRRTTSVLFVEDNFNNASAEIKDAELTTTTVATSAGTDNVASIQTTPATPGKVVVTFSKPVNVASAQDVSNYSVEEATVASAKVTSNNSSGATVELTLADDTVDATGKYNVTVQPITTFNVADTKNAVTTASVTLKENVRPTLTGKVLTNLAANALNVKLTFSDATITNGSELDFELFVDGKTTGEKINAATLATPVAGSLQVSWSDTDADVADLTAATSIKLVPVDSMDITDATGNTVKVSDIVIK